MKNGIVNTICHVQSISEKRDAARKGGFSEKNKRKSRINFFLYEALFLEKSNFKYSSNIVFRDLI